MVGQGIRSLLIKPVLSQEWPGPVIEGEIFMPHIQVLDQITIDKIAAGEVIERPASIVKELAENAVDAKATSVVVEIKEGGISFIRITDNGSGIPREDVPYAFLRHSTSKIRSVDDLVHVGSLGFRGEALSSIAAVTKAELMTKTRDEDMGTRYVIEGGQELSIDEAGTPDGTTFLIRQLFYNVPARRKFLKTPMTEAGHVQDLLMRLALSHPEVSFQLINNGQEKLRTSGNGRLKDVIYNIYGREAAASLIEIDYEAGGMRITGYLGKPAISRGNRNFENFFVNGRYVKSAMLSKAVEDGYRDFVMQHKFPFVVLHFQMDGEDIDINVHPTKMELRFKRQQEVYNTVFEGVHRTLLEPELIPVVDVPNPPPNIQARQSPFLLKPRTDALLPSDQEKGAKGVAEASEPKERDEEYFLEKMKERVLAYHNRTSAAEVSDTGKIGRPGIQVDKIRQAAEKYKSKEIQAEAQQIVRETGSYEAKMPEPAQINLFQENLLRRDTRAEYKLIGQVFDTYWLVEYEESLYIIDQHAAHERVLYERTLEEMKTRDFTSQYLSPPIILSLSMQEAEILRENKESFERIGFEIEPFGGGEYAVRAVPDNLFCIAKKELLMEMLDGLADGISTSMAPELVDEKIASLSCKAAVKGNSRLSAMEVDSLIGELLTLENPYHCPHGRPTIIAMTRREMEKKFKRIV